jgi:DNA-binding NarL/FixJ family response regulator
MDPMSGKNVRTSPISVAIVEDSRDLRVGMSYILEGSSTCRCVGAFPRAEGLLDRISELRPEVVLMDIGLPQISGVEATRLIKKSHPEVEIVILSVFEDDENIFQAICAGAGGYVTKPVMPQRLLEVVQEAADGATPLSPHIARKVLRLFKKHIPVPGADYDLTPREREVLELLVGGHDFKEVADRLVVSVYTVRAHIRNIYEKLHVHSKSQAVAKALREGLL